MNCVHQEKERLEVRGLGLEVSIFTQHSALAQVSYSEENLTTEREKLSFLVSSL